MKKISIVIALMLIECPTHAASGWFYSDNPDHSTFLAVFYTLYKKLFTHTLSHEEMRSVKNAINSLQNYKYSGKSDKKDMSIDRSSIETAIETAKKVLPLQDSKKLEEAFNSVSTKLRNRHAIKIDQEELNKNLEIIRSNLSKLNRSIARNNHED